MKKLFFRLFGIIVLLGSFFSPVLAAPTGQGGNPMSGPDHVRRLYELDDNPLYASGMSARVDQQLPTITSLSNPWSKIVFQSYRDNNYEIYIMEGDGTGVTRLTNNVKTDIDPSLNKGCTRITFATNRLGDYDIYTMNIDGSGLVRLTSSKKDDVFPDWSPDGTRIVFQSYRDGQSEIYTMNADGTNQVRLTNEPNYDGMPAWSPDGSKIAFVTNRSGGYRVSTMNPDGSGVVQLSNQQYSAHPSWSPEGNQITYDSDADNDGWQELWLMSADGSQQQRVFTSSGSNSEAYAGSWSPNGKYISYTQLTWMSVANVWQLIVATLDVIDPTNLAFYMIDTYDDMDPDWQTTDNVLPVSNVSSLPDESPATFVVNWSVSQVGPTGLRSFDVDVKDGSTGVWTRWQNTTSATSASYTGVGGHIYYFRSRALSNGGILENWPADYDAITRVESYPPRSSILSLPAHLRNGSPISWSGVDVGGSGIKSYDVQTRDSPGGVWAPWLTGTTQTQEIFSGTPGHTYSIRVRGTDLAENVEAWHAGDGEASTTMYTWAANGMIVDNTDVPAASVDVSIGQHTTTHTYSDKEGNFQAYLNEGNEWSPTYSINWQKSNYADLPITNFEVGNDFTGLTVMPPVDNVIQDWGFENNILGKEWKTGGLYPPVLMTTAKHTGNYGISLGPIPDGFNTSIKIGPGIGELAKPSLVVDKNGTVHAMWLTGSPFLSDIYYSYRDLGGQWSNPVNISNSNTAGQVKFGIDDAGNLHAIWTDVSGMFYAERKTNGIWTTPYKFSNKHGGQQIAVSGAGSLFVVWTQINGGGNDIYYVGKDEAGNWSSPVSVSKVRGTSQFPSMVLDQKGILHLIWTDITDNCLYYAQKSPNQPWSIQQSVLTGMPVDSKILADSSGKLHIIYFDHSDSTFYYAFRNTAGVWSTKEKLAESPSGSMYGNGSYGSNDLAVEPNGTVHAIWRSNISIEYSRRNTQGSWSVPLKLDTSDIGDPKLVVDGSGKLHAVWISGISVSGYGLGLYYAIRFPDGRWTSPQYLQNHSEAGAPDNPTIVLGLWNQVHVIWGEMEWNYTGVYYWSDHTINQPGVANLSQRFTVPVTMTAPALSFIYQLQDASTGAGFNVLISDSLTTTQVIALDSDRFDWSHAWADLSRWSGQTITMTFSLAEVFGHPFAGAFLDEVTVGSAHPDVWVNVQGPLMAPPGHRVAYRITYGNRGGLAAPGTVISATLPDELEFVSASLPPTITGKTLRWSTGDLPAKSGPYTIIITATVGTLNTVWHHITLAADITTPGAELEVENNHDQANTTISWAVFLPLTRKE